MKKYIFILTVGILSISAFWLYSKNVSKSILDQINNPQVDTTITASANRTQEFSFSVIADPHMDEQSSSEVFTQTLKNIVSSKCQFMIDLGDTYMIDKLENKTEASIRERYVLMKSYYDLLGTSIPLYMVLGNHDGEAGWDKTSTKNYRLEYFPTQNKDKNYYSLEQGGTLFIMLDPYTYTTTKPNINGWLWTLGKTQYDWLKITLENSKARYKFIFIHQLVGGDNQGRGGVEYAKLYEWGGNNTDGNYGFDLNRPGWGKPIHQLLVDNGVQIVFKGHDHFYAKQELDGIIYQTLPQPSHPGDKVNTAQEYGYINGKILGGSGYLDVSISSSNAKVSFIATQAGGKTTSVLLDSYTVSEK